MNERHFSQRMNEVTDVYVYVYEYVYMGRTCTYTYTYSSVDPFLCGLF